jgi:HAD superfamily hydrolase (TIGR01509 family)
MTHEAGLGALAVREGSCVSGPPAAHHRSPNVRHARRRTGSRRAPIQPAVDVHEPRPLDLDTLASRWQLALDATQRALGAGGGFSGLPAVELNRRRRELARERQRTAQLLANVSAMARARYAPWLSPVPLKPQMLGLPSTVRACLFDLDGVLTNSGRFHSAAWAEVFDDLLLRHAEKAGWQFRPFDRYADYRTYLEGRPRIEGIHAFLDSRGLQLPEGTPDDRRSMDTAYGLAKRKNDALVRALSRHGVSDLPQVRRYLEAVGHTGIERAVISASANTLPMLESAGLATLVDARVDADVIRTEGLRSRPAPDMVLAACRHVGVPPKEAVAFTQSPAGIQAARAAGAAVIGIANGAQREVLHGSGADCVVPSLGSLLDRQLIDARQ